MTLQNMVKDQVTEFIKNNRKFTAYDVTKAVRNKSWYNYNAFFHSEVKSIVHKLYFEDEDLFGDYLRTWGKVAEGKYASIFHPASETSEYVDPVITPMDVEDYASAMQNVSSSVRTEPAKAFGLNPSNDLPSKNIPLGVLKTDRYNRIRLKKDQVKGLGFNPGDKMYVMFKPDKDGDIKIFHDTHKTNRGVNPYKVDEYGNVRIALKKRGIEGTEFEVRLRGKEGKWGTLKAVK